MYVCVGLVFINQQSLGLGLWMYGAVNQTHYPTPVQMLGYEPSVM